jgi:hypothetical protein
VLLVQCVAKGDYRYFAEKMRPCVSWKQFIMGLGNLLWGTGNYVYNALTLSNMTLRPQSLFVGSAPFAEQETSLTDKVLQI